MFNRSRMVAEYSSRFKRRIGQGPGNGPAAQALWRRVVSSHATNASRSSIPGAGRPFGGISLLRTRVSSRFQSACLALNESAGLVRLRLERRNAPAAALPPWHAVQYLSTSACVLSNDHAAGTSAATPDNTGRKSKG